jgi:aspartyl-tRNA(Asn)/glutamyl-tRNA(Gln) amidotransferase subunit C
VTAALDRDEVIAIAHLARIALRDDEIEHLRGELAAILGHVAALAEVDVTGVEPMTHPQAVALRLRDDLIEPSLPVELALADAPAARDGGFEVPAVLRGDP